MTVRSLDDSDRLRLAESPFLSVLTEEERASAIAGALLRTFRADQPLFAQGAPIDGLYVLLEGCAKLQQLGADGDEVILRLVVPGEVTAAVAALDRVAHFPVGCRALTPVRAAFWPRPVIRAVFAAHPPLAAALLGEIADRTQEMQRRFRQAATEKVPRRLAGLLLRLARRAGRPVEGGVLIDLPLTREELAQMVGTTLFTVSRLLSEWAAEGWVDAGRQRVVVRDPEELRRAFDLEA